MNKFIESLKKDPECLYIYVRDLSIYNLLSITNCYTVIVKDSWEIPVDWEDPVIIEFGDYNRITIDNNIFYIYTITKWFDKVLHGDLICWICACLNKKFVIKEHVKLMMKTDILQLRKHFDAELDPKFLYGQSLLSDTNTKDHGIELLWELIRDVKFINQIYDNHKIVNFKEANKDWEQINSYNTEEDVLKCWINCIAEPLKLLHLRTDSLIKEEKIKKIKNEQNIST